MRLTQIEAKNFLSLRDFALALDDRNVLVGPNGAGKSNVFRCVDLVVKALAFAQEGGGEAYALLDDYATAANRRSGDDSFEVRVGLEFSESWERQLILLFVRAAALTNLLAARQEPVVPIVVDGQVRKVVTAPTLRSLNRGAVVVRYEPGQWPWSIGYAFEHADTTYTYGVRGAGNSGIVQGDLPPVTSPHELTLRTPHPTVVRRRSQCQVQRRKDWLIADAAVGGEVFTTGSSRRPRPQLRVADQVGMRGRKIVCRTGELESDRSRRSGGSELKMSAASLSARSSADLQADTRALLAELPLPRRTPSWSGRNQMSVGAAARTNIAWLHVSGTTQDGVPSAATCSGSSPTALCRSTAYCRQRS
jgi:energy-coupling factor transporter ATP-binding protein EcfA2